MSLLLENASVWEWTNCSQHEGKVIPHSWVAVNKDGWIEGIGASHSTPPSPTHFHHVINLKGALVLPGLQDAHLHVAAVGESQYFLDLSECTSISDLQEALRVHAMTHSEVSVVVGVNWDQKKLGGTPREKTLTLCVVIDLYSSGGHAGI